MFEALSHKLGSVFQGLGNKGRLTEKDIDSALREIRLAMLEADVNFAVVKDLLASIRERALENDVLRSLSPGQQVIKITNDELIKILDAGSGSLTTGSSKPSVALLVGLNGSGKTTTAAKLAHHLKLSGQKSLLVAADLARPAAIDQLQLLGEQIGIEVFTGDTGKTSVEVANHGIRRAANLDTTWVIVDTAGRFQLDDRLMEELTGIAEETNPSEILMVVDSMTGQEAVAAAEEFNRRLGLTGLVLTKMDGDARGGAALSIARVTGIPIKFIGTGERIDAIERFHPDRLASRILGMGDMLTLIEKTQGIVDGKQALELNKKIRKATFDLEDFLVQLQQVKRIGPFSQILDMMPKFGAIRNNISTETVGEDQITKIEAIIHSMTIEERRRPEIIGGSRRRRISIGSGTSPQDVNQLLSQFRQMKKIMKHISSGKGLSGLDQMFK